MNFWIPFRNISERLKAPIEKELKDNPLISILNSLPGFGKILSALAALEIDDIKRFRTPAKFASYSGLIPSTFGSGGKVYHGDLIPAGNRWLQYIFIEASWSSLRSSPYSRDYFNRIKHRKGSNVAIVALARRLSEMAYQCLKGNDTMLSVLICHIQGKHSLPCLQSS